MAKEDGKTVLILINHNKAPEEMTDLLAANHTRVSMVSLPKYGVAVLEK